MSNHVIIRADASVETGTGHIMRCLALAKALQLSGTKVHFLSYELPDALLYRIEESGCTLEELKVKPYGKEDIDATINLIHDLDSQWVVVDGYNFDADYQHALKKQNVKVLFIDDYGHAKDYLADLVLNQNVYANDLYYQKKSDETALLLGPKFALLREEFSGLDPQTDFKSPAKILVTLGGADANNVTGKVIDALSDIENIEVTVVVGGTNPHLETIDAACKEASMNLEVDSNDMRGLMAQCTIAITSGGTTCLELACMGVPMINIILADNQKVVAEGIEKEEVGINLGWYTDVTIEGITSALKKLIDDPKTCVAMSKKGSELVDGHGAARVCREMLGEKLWLRKATMDDCGTLLNWANNEETRAMSFSSDPISETDHVQWFKGKVGLPTCLFLIAMNEIDERIGQIRFDTEENHSTISVSITPEQRGKGYGTAIIAQGCHHLFACTSIDTIDAYIKKGNIVSATVFQKVGFVEMNETEVKGQTALHYTLTR